MLTYTLLMIGRFLMKTSEENEIVVDDEELYSISEKEEITPSPQEPYNKIVSYNVSNSVEVLISKIENDEINLRPEFQRDFVWDINRASLFIDSLIIGLPIPSIFLGKRKSDESFIVIDGQQRLKSLYYFFKGKFKSNRKERKFLLQNLDNRDWNSKSYEELGDVPQRSFRNAVLNTTVIENIDVTPTAISDIFHRLNTGGMALNDQEIRNCIYAGEFNQLLAKMNDNKDWLKLLGKIAPNKRLRDIELILRFIALNENYANYQPSMREFLNKFMEKNQDENLKFNEIIDLFNQTVNKLNKEIGQDAFRQKRYFNRAICDAIMVGIASLIKDGNLTKNLKVKHAELLNDSDFSLYVSESTTVSKNVIGRINLAKKYFSL
jgi:hypothetical protein